MRVLTAVSHGIVDYVVVALLVVAPPAFGLPLLPTLIAYGVAALHLAVSLCTRYRLGMFRRIPFGAHGLLEVAMSVLLVALPWLVGFETDTAARILFVCAGVLLFAIWLVTDYGTPAAHRHDAAPPPA